VAAAPARPADTRTTPIPPRPGAVAMATMGSESVASMAELGLGAGLELRFAAAEAAIAKREAL
jgi:hypothetical protein